MVKDNTQIRTIKQLPRWICFRVVSCGQTSCDKNSRSCADCRLNDQTSGIVPILASDCIQYEPGDESPPFATYDEAMIYHERSDTDTDGVAFMLSGSTNAIMLDECRDPETGEIEDWAESIVDQVDTYTEISHDGTGLRLIVTDDLTDASLEEIRRNTLEPSEAFGSHDHARVTVYEEGYIIPTGDQLSSTSGDVQA